MGSRPANLLIGLCLAFAVPALAPVGAAADSGDARPQIAQASSELDDWNATLALFSDEYHVPLLPPALAAVMGAGGELVFSTLVAFGLAGRVAALGLFFVNAVAVISYPQLFQFECPAAIQSHFFWGTLIAMLAAYGPGKLSIDTVLMKVLK